MPQVLEQGLFLFVTKEMDFSLRLCLSILHFFPKPVCLTGERPGIQKQRNRRKRGTHRNVCPRKRGGRRIACTEGNYGQQKRKKPMLFLKSERQKNSMYPSEAQKPPKWIGCFGICFSFGLITSCFFARVV